MAKLQTVNCGYGSMSERVPQFEHSGPTQADTNLLRGSFKPTNNAFLFHAKERTHFKSAQFMCTEVVPPVVGLQIENICACC